MAIWGRWREADKPCGAIWWYVKDEAGTAAIKTVELDAALGDRAVQYREVQGHETDKFLSYFKPCIIPLEGGVASGFKKVEKENFEPRLYTCKGRRVVRVQQVNTGLLCWCFPLVFMLEVSDVVVYRFLMIERLSIMMMFLFWTRNLKCINSMAQHPISRNEPKHWGLYSTLRKLTMMECVMLQLLVRICKKLSNS